MPLDPVLDHIQSTPPLLKSPQSFWNASVGTPAPKGCWDVHTESQGWLHATAKGIMLFCLGEASPLPRRSWDRAGSHPSTQNKMTHERKQTKTEESHPGWRRRAEAPLRGRGLHLMNASGLGRCERKWGGQKEEMRGMGGDSRGEKEQSCSLGQIFCCFIRFSVNQLVFARTGERRGVLKRARARGERDHENGHHQLPRGLHLAVIICTNSS